ncbi:MAG: helix-turn-helix domain-containing protein [Parvibaculum sp.]
MMNYRDEIGETLRTARQAAGLSLRDIAAETRIKPVYLQAIEAGQFDRLPALPQTLGFTRAYARHLNVDVDAPLARLGEEVHRNIESADFSAPELPWSQVPLARIGWAVAGALLGMGLLAALLFGFETPRVEPVPVATPPSSPVAAPSVAPAEPVASPAPERSVNGSSPVSASMAENLRRFEPASVTPPPVPAPDLFATRSVYLRAAPANEGRELGVLSACEGLTLFGESPNGQWREVGRGDGVRGWVFHRFVVAEPAPACR